jgi:hypothetical protein
MTDSILTKTKLALDIEESYTEFDIPIIMHINSAFATLTQLGVGPVNGFEIQDASTTWETYIVADKNLNSVKTYIFIRVKLLFDPPPTSFASEALKKQADEIEWRLNIYSEGKAEDVSVI